MPAIWAVSTAAPGNTCANAQHLGPGRNLSYPSGDLNGQAGWDIGISFKLFSDLANNLKAATDKNGKCGRLAINLHGETGVIDADSNGTEVDLKDLPSGGDDYPPAKKMYNYKMLKEKYRAQLTQINSCLTDDATLLFMGCLLARDQAGERFLREISAEFFKGKKVVGFKTVGVTIQQFRAGESCTNPGMRDSPWSGSSSSWGDAKKIEREKMLADPRSLDPSTSTKQSDIADLNKPGKDTIINIPWASESSPNAKVARDGKIISGADPVIVNAPVTSESYMVDGFFNAQAGGTGPTYLMVFKADKTCYWKEQSGTKTHNGKWSVTPGGLEWSYDDDTKGWERLFRLKTPVARDSGGALTADVTIKGVPHGWYKMYKQ